MVAHTGKDVSNLKKIINQPEQIVLEMCNGIVSAHPELKLLSKYKVITKKSLDPNKVTLISGGGSGHEPAHAGFIGDGLLDAAVCGDIFASPSQIQVYQALKATESKKGTLLIIKNYSGDMMNFKNAAFLAEEDGMEVDYVRVEDDIAVEDSLYTVGRRGVAGTIFVHKIAGAAAKLGKSLSEVKVAAQKCADHVRSIGFALTSCTVPAKGTPTFSLQEDEMEYGVGIHGEPGCRREKIVSANELAERMSSALLSELNIHSGDEIAVLINGFGATPLQELYLLQNAVANHLTSSNVVVMRTLVGNFMTSIDMAGASISFLKLDAELKQLLDVSCDAPALKISTPSMPMSYTSLVQTAPEMSSISFQSETDPTWSQIQNEHFTLQNMIYLVDKMSEYIIENEVPFCELDSHAGDGDFGMSVAKGFRQLKREWQDLIQYNCEDIGSFLHACSMIIMEHCGGASGPIWGSAFRAASKFAGERTALSAVEFSEMMQAAVKGVQATGERSFGRGAVVGDKTLIDALIPCADTWTTAATQGKSFSDCFALAATAAVEGAEKTKEIVAHMGRAGTVGERSIGYADAGAYALGFIFTKLAEDVH